MIQSRPDQHQRRDGDHGGHLHNRSQRTDRAIQKRAEWYYDTERANRIKVQNPTEAGVAWQKSVRGALDQSKKEMSAAFDKTDALVTQYGPKFDISDAQKAARDRVVNGLKPEEFIDLPPGLQSGR